MAMNIYIYIYAYEYAIIGYNPLLSQEMSRHAFGSYYNQSSPLPSANQSANLNATT